MRWDYPPLDMNPVFPGHGDIIIIIIIIIITIIIVRKYIRLPWMYIAVCDCLLFNTNLKEFPETFSSKFFSYNLLCPFNIPIRNIT